MNRKETIALLESILDEYKDAECPDKYLSEIKILGKQYIIYDGRYHHDIERASIYECCSSLEEAEESKRDSFPDGVIVEEWLERTG